MRLLRTLIHNLTRSAPKRGFAHVHDVQIKWERVSGFKEEGKEKEKETGTGSMALNGMFVSFSLSRGEELGRCAISY
jgi:hypothetical protein